MFVEREKVREKESRSSRVGCPSGGEGVAPALVHLKPVRHIYSMYFVPIQFVDYKYKEVMDET